MDDTNQAGPGAEVKIGFGDLEGTEEDLVEVPVPHIKTGEPVGTMFFRRVKMPIISRYREIRNGEGRKKGNEIKANEYLFTRAFDRFEFKVRGASGEWVENPATLDLGPHKTELAFWLSCGKLVDSLLIKFNTENFPELDLRKSGSGGQDHSES
ncbi:MAG: hypothetical protein AABN33_18455 [Acidobacteriota bacterium]